MVDSRVQPSLSRRIALASLALAVAAPVVAAQQLTHAPGVRRYRLLAEFSQTQDMLGAPVEVSATSDQVITLSITTRSRDTLGFTIVVDSFRFTLSPEVPAAALPDYRGMRVTGTMSPLGKVYSIAATPDTLPEMVKEYRNFFITLPASAAVGRTWNDTTTMPLEAPGMSFGSATAITTSKIVADTIYNGAPAWKIERGGNASGGGSTERMGMPVALRTSMKASGIVFVSHRGVLLSAEGNAVSDVSMTLPSQNITIPLNQRSTNSITLIGTPPAIPGRAVATPRPRW
jgi:hypothetical protein